MKSRLVVREELDIYKKLPRCSRSKDILEWWSENERMLPRLSILARWTLCVPAGSAASEQLFSIAGLFDTVRRGRLDTETFELLTLQKSNQETLETLDSTLDNLSDDDMEDENQNHQLEDDTDVNSDIENESEEEEDELDVFSESESSESSSS